MSWSQYDDKPHPLVGKKITAAAVAVGGESITFDVEGGDPITGTTYGDCCSSTWIEGVEGLDRIVGGVVAKVEDIAMPDQPYSAEEHESLAFYGCQITTDKGTAVIDYRNSSNGYYGGSLAW